MFNKIKKISSLHLLSFSVSAVAIIYLMQILAGFLKLFSDVILVIVLSWLVSFVIEPLVDRLTKHGLSRTKSAILVYIIFTTIVIVLIVKAVPVLVLEINSLVSILPAYLDYYPGWTNRMGDFVISSLNNSVGIVSQIASGVFYLIFILLLSFYLVVDQSKIKKGLLLFIPTRFRDEAEYLHEAINKSFSGFIRAQVIFGILFGLATLIFLLIFAPAYALLAAVLAGVLNMLPVIGAILALVPILVVLLPFGLNQVFWLIMIIFLFQQIIFNVLGPKIYGENVKLHPIWILISFLLGFKIAGVWGSIFAVPVASVVGILVSTVARRFLNHTGRE